jgi:hypothetical protein
MQVHVHGACVYIMHTSFDNLEHERSVPMYACFTLDRLLCQSLANCGSQHSSVKSLQPAVTAHERLLAVLTIILSWFNFARC